MGIDIITKQDQIENLPNHKDQENELNDQKSEQNKITQSDTDNQNQQKENLNENKNSINNFLKDDISIHVDTYNKDDNLLDNISNLEIPNNIIITETNINTENKDNNNMPLNIESLTSNNNINQQVKDENNKLNDNLKVNNKENNENNNNEKNTTEIKTIKKIKIKKKKPTSTYKQNKNININTNHLNNFRGNNNNVSESVYLQYNTLFQNKEFLNKNKNIIKKPTERNKKHMKYKNKCNSIDTKRSQNDEKFTSVYQRFIEDQKKKKEKIVQMQKSQEEHEKELCSYKPKLNKKSQEIISKNKDDFYTRQKKMLEDKKKKEEQLREKLKKEKQDEINKNNILLIHCSSPKDKNKKNRKKSTDDRIKNLYEWDTKRKEKLNDKIKNKEKSIKSNMKNKPKIDKYSYKITVNRKPDEIFKRLYLDDVIKRKERKELLQQIYTPSFRPNITEKKTRKKRQRLYSMNSSHLNGNGSSKNLNSVMSSKTNFMKESESEENEFDDDIIKNEYLYNYDDKEMNNIIRTHVFSKISNNKKSYNTSMNLETRKENEDDDEDDGEDDGEDNDEDNYKNNEEDNDENDNLKKIVYNKGKKVNFNKNGSTGVLVRNNNNNKIKIKKKYGYLLTESKNRNRSGYL